MASKVRVLPSPPRFALTGYAWRSHPKTVAMTSHFKHDSAISRRDAPEFCKNRSPKENRGRRECRVPNAPAASRAKKNKAHEHSHHRFRRIQPAFPAQWFYGLLRALPGDQACLTPSPALLIADLTPALGRQNDTTWPYASASFVRLAIARLTLPRPPHPAPRS